MGGGLGVLRGGERNGKRKRWYGELGLIPHLPPRSPFPLQALTTSSSFWSPTSSSAASSDAGVQPSAAFSGRPTLPSASPTLMSLSTQEQVSSGRSGRSEPTIRTTYHHSLKGGSKPHQTRYTAFLHKAGILERSYNSTLIRLFKKSSSTLRSLPSQPFSSSLRSSHMTSSYTTNNILLVASLLRSSPPLTRRLPPCHHHLQLHCRHGRCPAARPSPDRPELR